MTKQKKEHSKPDHHTELHGPEGAACDAPTTAIILDPDKYRPLMADENLTADQERAFIEVVWAMLLQAMMLGIRLELDAEIICGQDDGPPLPAPIAGADRVESRDEDLQFNFNDTATRSEAKAARGNR